MFGAHEIGSMDALFAQGEPLDAFSFTLGRQGVARGRGELGGVDRARRTEEARRP